jgi:hypothetical protein
VVNVPANCFAAFVAQSVSAPDGLPVNDCRIPCVTENDVPDDRFTDARFAMELRLTVPGQAGEPGMNNRR